MKIVKLMLLLTLAAFYMTAIADNPLQKKKKEKEKWTLTVESNIASTVLHRPKIEESDFPEQTVYFGQDDDPFVSGGLRMRSLIASMADLEKDNLWNSFVFEVKESLKNEELLYNLGAITYFNTAAYKHHDPEDNNATEDLDLNRLISEMAHHRWPYKNPSYYGVCRDFAFATAKLAEEAFNFPALGVAGHEHVITQLLTSEGIVLIDHGFHGDVNNYRIKNKDDVDVISMGVVGIPQIQDLTIDAERNAVVYDNKYNNFAGFWSRLQNRDNSDRTRNFLLSEEASLFSYINEKGVSRISLEKENFGLQLYGVSKNNEYNRFLVNNYGANIAFVPWKNLKSGKAFHHETFFNLGIYSLKSTSDNKVSGINHSWNTQITAENYLKYSFRNNLTAGLSSRFSRLNQKISSFKFKRPFDNSYINFYSSPFLGWEKESGINKKFLLAGLEGTMYFALPKANKVSGVPWISVGSRCETEKESLMYYVKTEIQKASTRADVVVNYKTKKRRLDIRSFYENYNKNFKEKSLFVNAYGIDVTFGQTFLKNKEVFLSSSFKSTNSKKQKLIFSIGFKF
jgi:hypothetical protein